MSEGTSLPGHAPDGWGACLPSPFIPEATSPLPDTLLQGLLQGTLAFPGPSQLRPRLPIPRGRQQLASQTCTVCASTAPGPDPTPNNHRMEKSWSWHCSPLPVRSCLLVLGKKGKVHIQAGEGVGPGPVSCLVTVERESRLLMTEQRQVASSRSGRGSAPGSHPLSNCSYPSIDQEEPR